LPKRKLTLLVDADLYLFMAASAVEIETQWGAWEWTLTANLQEAAAKFDNAVDSLMDELKGTDVIMALTDDVNWRKDVLPTYKHNRVGKRKPTCYKALRDYCAEKYRTFQRPTLEGDDVLGILATSKKLVKGDRIVCSADKDFKTIPGQLWNGKELRTVTEAEADYAHLIQTLTGDATDGYSGCPGIGPVKAEKALAETPGWAGVVATYGNAGLSEEAALQQARVARICRVSDYDFKKKEVRLWAPKKQS